MTIEPWEIPTWQRNLMTEDAIKRALQLAQLGANMEEARKRLDAQRVQIQQTLAIVTQSTSDLCVLFEKTCREYRPETQA